MPMVQKYESLGWDGFIGGNWHSPPRAKAPIVGKSGVEADSRTILERGYLAFGQESDTMRKAVNPCRSRSKCSSSKGDYATRMQLGSVDVSMGFR